MISIIAHKRAVVARLNTDTLLRTCGHEGVVTPDPVTQARPEFYWTLFTDSGDRFSDRLGGLPTQATFHYVLHWVGHSPEQAQQLAERGVALLAGWQPAVAGAAPFRMRHVGSTPTELDATVRPPLHFAVDRFDLTTQPA